MKRIFHIPVFLILFSAPFIPVNPMTANAATGLDRVGRWFTYNGEYTYLVGFDQQELAADTTYAYNTALNRFTQYGINKVRIWVYPWFKTPYPDGPFLTPWQYSNGKHNLDQWNSAYWQRVKDFIAAAKNKDIVVEVTIFAPDNINDSAEWSNTTYRSAENKNFNTNGVFSANANGHFNPQYFDLNYSSQVSTTGKKLKDYQQALVDKTVTELGGFNNVYFEIANEFPVSGNIDGVYPWQQYWARRVDSSTSRLVSAHSHQYGGMHTIGIQYFWNEPYIDVMNFHLGSGSHPNPQEISDLFHNAQTKNKVLSVNESGDFYGANLDPQTLEAWGMFLSGGHLAFYEDMASRMVNGDPGWIAGAQRLQILRNIVESLRFWEMSPVDAGGNEYDSLVTQGPSGANKQLIANPGSEYLAYFWGSKTTTPAKLTLLSGSYTYEWYDPRTGSLLLSGSVQGGGVTAITAPATTGWDAAVGVALIIRNVSSTSTIYLSNLDWTAVINGWGPAEKDTSNGESLSGDGKTITLNGTTYAKGLGTHSYSEIVYNINNQYSSFLSDIGVDDEIANGGSVIFQVWVDNIKLYDSGIMTGATATKSISIDLNSKNSLKLIVTDSGDNRSDDHADWAGARLIPKTITPDTIAPSVSIAGPTSSTAYSTTTSTIALSGTSADNIGVSAISWTSDKGGGGVAAGTTSWSIASIALLPGANLIMVTAKDAANNASTDTITVTYSATVSPAPVITSALSSTGTAGTAFSYQITAANSPTSFNAAGLPAVLSVSTGGLISGTPTTAGTSSVTISAANAGGMDAKTLTLSVYSACDLNRDGATNVVDVQLQVNQALGAAACTSDLNRDGSCNVIDVQRDVNAGLGGQCLLGP